jgi:molybdopterin/thiamine biosynthesis adenylyltransferase
MRYSLTFVEKDYSTLMGHLFSDPGIEQAAYLLCRSVKTASEYRLLVRNVIPVIPADIEEQDGVHMKIKSRSFLRAMKEADRRGESFSFVHSHPKYIRCHSPQDDTEEKKLFKTAYIRISLEGVHSSLVFTDPDHPIGRVWLENGATAPIDLIRVIGDNFKFCFRSLERDLRLDFFDRQIRIFGQDVQLLLRNLKIGIVGAGGTGSAVAEQLIRLGVGRLLVIDGDYLDPSNINRVYGSKATDHEIPKVRLIERLAADIGLGTVVETVQKPIFFESAFKPLRDCDIVFGCTDDEWGRSLLTRLAIYYYIPVFDLGVKIDSKGTRIWSIQGRVTTLIPSTACLFCRGRLTADNIRAESLQIFNPAEAKRLRDEGYVTGLEDRAPAVIGFTNAVASSAVLELLHRLTGCFGSDRHSSEVLLLFDSSRTRTNSRSPSEDCFCSNAYYWGRGDTVPLLDSTWPKE